MTDTADVRYLRVSGRLQPDGRLHLRPSYLSTNPRGAVDLEESDLQIYLYGDDRRLLRWGAQVAALHRDTTDPTDRERHVRAVRAKVPFHPETKRIVFEYDGVVVEEIVVPDEPPVVGDVRVDRTDDGWRIRWEASHPAEQPLHYHVRTSADAGETWRRLAWRLQEPRTTVRHDDLVGGENCLVEVVAYDGVNTTAARTDVPDTPEQSLDVEILAPTGGRADPPVELSAAVRLRGRPGFGSDDAEYTWSVDGEDIATGAFALWFDPAPGTHTIRVDARFEDWRAQDSVTVAVRGERTK
ncbi:MAG: hypothetical protein V5A16_01715 [Haloplanus sp.]